MTNIIDQVNSRIEEIELATCATHLDRVLEQYSMDGIEDGPKLQMIAHDTGGEIY